MDHRKDLQDFKPSQGMKQPGRGGTPSGDSEISKRRQTDESISLIDRLALSKVVILALQFGVMGCLGLPLVWWSSAFTRREKWFWSIIVTLYTLALVAGALWCVWWAWGNLREAGLL